MGHEFQELRCPSVQESTSNIEIGTIRRDGENHPGETRVNGRHYGPLLPAQVIAEQVIRDVHLTHMHMGMDPTSRAEPQPGGRSDLQPWGTCKERRGSH